jgi:hypothetical protein
MDMYIIPYLALSQTSTVLVFDDHNSNSVTSVLTLMACEVAEKAWPRSCWAPM